MRFFSLHKIGQSGDELVLSVFFSFFLHAALIILALILYTSVTPKIHVPTFYEVKLVGVPAAIAPAPAPAPASPPAAKAEPAPVEKKPEPKAKIAAAKPAVKALTKGDMPELSQKKTKPARDEDAKPAATGQAKPAPMVPTPAPNVHPLASAKPGGAIGGVEIKRSSGDPKILSYLPIITGHIQRNWKYPEGSKGMKVTVFFKVSRTGEVMECKISDSNANDSFERAATRAIIVSSPIPMPDDYYKNEEFTIDLEPQE